MTRFMSRLDRPGGTADSGPPPGSEVVRPGSEDALRARRTVVLLLLYVLAMLHVAYLVERATGSFAAGLVVFAIAAIVSPFTFKLFVRPRGSGTTPG